MTDQSSAPVDPSESADASDERPVADDAGSMRPIRERSVADPAEPEDGAIEDDAIDDDAIDGDRADGDATDGADDTANDAAGTSAGAARPGSSGDTSRLEEEGDVAADYLEELLDILDLDGDIDIDVENGRASVSVGDASVARSLRRLVGDDGEVLEALQELTRLAVQTKTGERTRLMLDVAGFRSSRKRELESLAAETIERVRTGGEPVSLRPMSPFARKVVHDVVAEAGLRSESEGEGGQRYVVIHPAAS